MANPVEAVRAFAERDLEPDEAQAYLDASMSDYEREHTVSLVEWFCRRYPAPAERLAYARRAYKRWMASYGVGYKQGDVTRVARQDAREIEK